MGTWGHLQRSAAAAAALLLLGACTAAGPSGDPGAVQNESSASASPGPSATTEATASPTPSASASAQPSEAAATEAAPSETATAEAAPPSSSAEAESTPEAASAAGGGICTAAMLTGEVKTEMGSGAAGSVYRSLVLTNSSGAACSVAGFPGVSYVDAAGTQIGAPAGRDSASPFYSIPLNPGESAAATLRQAHAQNYGADCRMADTAGLRVYPPGATDWIIVPQSSVGCTSEGIVLMTVGTMQPLG